MVPKPAPKAFAPNRRLSNLSAGQDGGTHQERVSWTQSYQSAYRRSRYKNIALIWTLIVFALLPVGLTQNFEVAGQAAEPETNSAEAPADSNYSSESRADATQTGADTSIADASNTDASPVVADSHQSKHANPIDRLPEEAGYSIRLNVIISGQKKSSEVTIPLKGASVKAALREMGIVLNKLDRVSPLPETAAHDNMTIRVTRVKAEIVKRSVQVVPTTRYKPTNEIPYGTKATLQKGQTGVVEISERVWSKDGKVTLRERVGRRVVKPAQNTIIGLGARTQYLPGRIPYHNRYARAYGLSARGGSPRDRSGAPTASPEPQTLRAVKSLTLIATGYSPDPRENGGYTTTATGLPIGYGAAAVDPSVIPLGSKLYVEGYGYAFACDTGGAIKGHRIDLAYDSYRLANTKGRKKVKVWILGK